MPRRSEVHVCHEGSLHASFNPGKPQFVPAHLRRLLADGGGVPRLGPATGRGQPARPHLSSGTCRRRRRRSTRRPARIGRPRTSVPSADSTATRTRSPACWSRPTASSWSRRASTARSASGRSMPRRRARSRSSSMRTRAGKEARRARQEGTRARPPASRSRRRRRARCWKATGTGSTPWASAATASGSSAATRRRRSSSGTWPSRKPVAKWSGHPVELDRRCLALAGRQDGPRLRVPLQARRFRHPRAGARSCGTWPTARRNSTCSRCNSRSINPHDAHLRGRSGVANVRGQRPASRRPFLPTASCWPSVQGGETDTGKVHLLDAATGKLVRDVSGH